MQTNTTANHRLISGQAPEKKGDGLFDRFLKISNFFYDFKTQEYLIEKEALQLLRSLAMKHDWYYHFESDHKAWQKGEQESNDILSLVVALGSEKSNKVIKEVKKLKGID